MTYRARCARHRERTMKPYTRCRMGWHVWRQYGMNAPLDRIAMPTFHKNAMSGPRVVMVWMCQRCAASVQAVDKYGRIDFSGHRHGIAYLKRAVAAAGIPIVEDRHLVSPGLLRPGFSAGIP